MVEEIKFYKEIKKSNQFHKKGDIFTISSFGNVRCNNNIYKCKKHKDGYYYFMGKPLHRIIAENFLPDWDPNKEVGHKDCNRLNNIVSNLYMCSHKENMNNPTTLQNLKGKQFSEETRKKISESKIGQKTFLNHHHSEEVKNKISESLKKYHKNKKC